MLESIRNIFSRIKFDQSFTSDMPGASSGFLIGHCTDTGKPVRLDDDAMGHHLLIAGATGIGKSVVAGNLVEHQIQRGGGLLFVDAMSCRPGLDEIYSRCVARGRENDFLVFNPGDPSVSNTYDPFLAMTSGTSSDIADFIMATIFPENTFGAEFLYQQSIAGIRVLVSALQAVNKKVSFLELATLLQNKEELENLQESVKAIKGAESDEYKLFVSFLNAFSVKGIKGGEAVFDMAKINALFGSLAARMNALGTGGFGKLMNVATSEINLIEAIQSNKIVYVMLPGLGDREAVLAIGKMFVANLHACIEQLRRLPKDQLPKIPFLCFKDEAFCYASEYWVGMYQNAVDANVILMSSTQTTRYLEAVSRDFLPALSRNIGVKIFLKASDSATTDYILDLANKHGAHSILTADMIRSLELGEAFVVVVHDEEVLSIFKVKIPYTPPKKHGIPLRIVHADSGVSLH